MKKQQLSVESDAIERIANVGQIRDDESDVAKRLSEVLGNDSIASFSRRSGVPESNLRSYVKRGIKPGLDHLVAIADAAGVNIAWLAAGRGPKKGAAPSQVQQQAIQAAPAPALNPELLQAAVEGVQEGLRRINRTVPADKHAQLIVAAYELLLDGQGNVSKNNVINFIRAAA